MNRPTFARKQKPFGAGKAPEDLARFDRNRGKGRKPGGQQ